MKSFHYFAPTEVVFGPGCIQQVGERSKRLGEQPLIVTGRRSARACGALDTALAQLPKAVVFDAVTENPDISVCEAGAAACRENACDSVIAIGGGSPMDAAKAIAVLARNPGRCKDFFGTDKYANGNLPVMSVPTTAGTGSEVTPYSVIVDPDTRTKRTIAGATLFPVVALLDPELSLSMPRHVTANTGLDALSQAMEGLVSRGSTPVGDVLALEACRIIKQWLPQAVEDPQNLEARSRMLYASMLAGCVIAQSGTTLVHGMGYYLTIEFGIPHGLANALLLAPVFQFNALHEPAKTAAIATALGCPAQSEPADARAKIGSSIHLLLRELGISPVAKDAGVDGNRLGAFAEHICADSYRLRNQVGNVTPEDVASFFRLAYRGTLS